MTEHERLSTIRHLRIANTNLRNAVKHLSECHVDPNQINSIQTDLTIAIKTIHDLHNTLNNV